MDKRTDWKAFCDCMRAAAAVTATKPHGGDALTLAFEVLSEYTIEQVQSAVRSHLSSDSGKFFPTPAHIIQQIQGSEAERGHLAWRVFLQALDRWGSYDSVRFPSPGYHYAIEALGGWVRISEEYGQMTDKELEFRRNAFVSLWARGERSASFVPAEGKTTVRAYLPGYFELDNSMRGYNEFIPDIVDVESGRKTRRDELQALYADAHTEPVLFVPLAP